MPQPKMFGEGLRNVDRTVGIVALPHVENARDAVDFSEVEVVEAVFAAGKRQDDGIHRCLFDKLRVVISARDARRRSRRRGKCAGSRRF